MRSRIWAFAFLGAIALIVVAVAGTTWLRDEAIDRHRDYVDTDEEWIALIDANGVADEPITFDTELCKRLRSAASGDASDFVGGLPSRDVAVRALATFCSE